MEHRPDAPARDTADVLVVGSANMDMVVQCDGFPRPGETVLARDFDMLPGGKGANQAVACARLGGRVAFLGKMGDDAFRAGLVESLDRSGVALDGLLTDADARTGVALITVDAHGENSIVVASGSNMRLTPADLDAHQDLFSGVRVVLVQLEIPLETVLRAAELAHEHGARLVLNPAPAQPLPDALLRLVDVLTPNQGEAAQLVGRSPDGIATAEAAARDLVRRGVRTVVVTLGADGALVVDAGGTTRVEAVPVRPVDTTGAGDAFNGALALALAEGTPVAEAVPLANAVAAYAVTQRGAQPAMPTRAMLDAFLDEATHPAARP